MPARAAAPSVHVLHRGGAVHVVSSAEGFPAMPRLDSLTIGLGMLPCSGGDFESAATPVRIENLEGALAAYAVGTKVALEPAPCVASDQGGDRLLKDGEASSCGLCAPLGNAEVSSRLCGQHHLADVLAILDVVVSSRSFGEGEPGADRRMDLAFPMPGENLLQPGR